MPTLGMQDPHKLDKDTVDKQVMSTSAGNYALGEKDKDEVFKVYYVGRSDSDLNKRLKSWIGKTRRPYFKFSYATSPKAAFEKECENYHDFDPPDNDIHPDRPNNSDWKCPRCRKFD